MKHSIKETRKRNMIRMRIFRLFPKAKTKRCVDCRIKPAHDYDHPKGYEGKNWLIVEPICRSCHQKRSYRRGELKSYDKHGSRNPNWKGGISSDKEYMRKRSRKYWKLHHEKWNENRRKAHLS